MPPQGFKDNADRADVMTLLKDLNVMDGFIKTSIISDKVEPLPHRTRRRLRQLHGFRTHMCTRFGSALDARKTRQLLTNLSRRAG